MGEGGFTLLREAEGGGGVVNETNLHESGIKKVLLSNN